MTNNRLMDVAAVVIFLLIPQFAYGDTTSECTPAPDCAGLGYDQTTCPGGFLRCPFDTNMLFCMPDCNLEVTAEQCAAQCKEVGTQSCVRDGVTYYAGCGDNLCNGTQECSVGDDVTAGECIASGLGQILYSDMTISSEIVSGKTAIGVVVGGSGDSTIRYVIGLSEAEKPWSTSASNSSLTDFSLKEDVIQDKSGKSGTSVLVAGIGDNSNYAAGYCYNYTTSGTTKGQWYLPAAGELYTSIYQNYAKVNETLERLTNGTLLSSSTLYWSVNEKDADTAWGVKASEDIVQAGNKVTPDVVTLARCMFSVTNNQDGTVTPICESGYHWENNKCTPDCPLGQQWNGSACICMSSYKYDCAVSDSVSGGSGIECDGKYAECLCTAGSVWSNGRCVCSSAYKYTCDGEGEAGGSSGSCGGKYTDCKCQSGYYWSNGACKVNCYSTCDVGAIYYSDGTCNSCVVSGKTPVGVIAYNYGTTSRLIISLGEESLPWAASQDLVSGINDGVSGVTGTRAWTSYYGTGDSAYAAGYCYNFTTTGTSVGQWFLPSDAEWSKVALRLELVNKGLLAAGGSALSGNYWSTTQVDTNSAKVCNNGSCSSADKLTSAGVHCLRFAVANDANTKLSSCDSAYKFACSGEGYSCGMGEACGELYKSCECEYGYNNVGSVCYLCDTSCDTVGNIMYSDNTCSSCMLTDKTAVAVVVYKSEDKHLIAPLTAPVMRWSSSNTDVTSLPNWSSADLAKEDMDGVGNSQLIREFFTSDNGTNNAAWYCYNLEVEGFEDKKGEWYLPSAGEIYNYFYTNYSLINKAFLKLGLTFGKAYWSSSESDPYHAWYVISSSGNMINYSKNGNPSVRCLLVINK